MIKRGRGRPPKVQPEGEDGGEIKPDLLDAFLGEPEAPVDNGPEEDAPIKPSGDEDEAEDDEDDYSEGDGW